MDPVYRDIEELNTLLSNPQTVSQVSSKFDAYADANPQFLSYLMSYLSCHTKTESYESMVYAFIYIRNLLMHSHQQLLDNFDTFLRKLLAVTKKLAFFPDAYAPYFLNCAARIISLSMGILSKKRELLHHFQPFFHLFEECDKYYEFTLSILRYSIYFPDKIQLRSNLYFAIFQNCSDISNQSKFKVFLHALSSLCRDTRKCLPIPDEYSESYHFLFQTILAKVGEFEQWEVDLQTQFLDSISDLNLEICDPQMITLSKALAYFSHPEVDLSIQESLLRFILSPIHSKFLSPEALDAIAQRVLEIEFSLDSFETEYISLLCSCKHKRPYFAFFFQEIATFLRGDNIPGEKVLTAAEFLFSICYNFGDNIDQQYVEPIYQLAKCFFETVGMYKLRSCATNIISVMINLFPDLEIVESFLIYFIEWIQTHDSEEPQLYVDVLSIFILLDSDIDPSRRLLFFNSFLTLYSQNLDAPLYIQMHLMMILISNMPKNPLIPESQYSMIGPIIEKYNSLQFQDDVAIYIVSIFILKLYFIGQIQYADLVPQCFNHLKQMVFSQDVGNSLQNDALLCIKKVISFNQEEGFELIRQNNNYQKLFTTLQTTAPRFQKPYLFILSLACEFDKDNFDQRSEFSRFVCRQIIQIDAIDSEHEIDIFESAMRFLYRIETEDFHKINLGIIQKKLTSFIKTDNQEGLDYILQYLISFVAPDHVEKNTKEFYKTQLVPAYVQLLNDVTSHLLELYQNTNPELMRFIFLACGGLVPYDTQSLHVALSMLTECILAIPAFQYYLSELFTLYQRMIEQKKATPEEIAKLLNLINTILASENSECYSDGYCILSVLGKENPKLLFKFFPILLAHWQNLVEGKDASNSIPTLGTVIIMTIATNSDQFGTPEQLPTIIDLANSIYSLITITSVNVKTLLLYSIDFWKIYHPYIPLNLHLLILKLLITFLSYKMLFETDEIISQDFRQQIVTFIIEYIKNFSTGVQEIFNEVFPESPIQMTAAMEALGIVIEAS